MKSHEMLTAAMLDYEKATKSHNQKRIAKTHAAVDACWKLYRRDRAYLEQQNPACRRTGDPILAQEYGEIQDPWDGGEA